MNIKQEVNWETLASEASARSNIYGLLAIIFFNEPDSVLIRKIRDHHFLMTLSSLDVNLDEDFLNKPESILLEELSLEYTKLFIGPDKHINPSESVHVDKSLLGESAVKVKRFIEVCGFSYKHNYTGLDDHISVELEFLKEITKEESKAWSNKNESKAKECKELELKFINEHLSKWINGFCDKVISNAELAFYREFAKFTKSFIEV